MAAIDKIYVNTKEEYLQFKEWCEQQPPIQDKYGKSIRLTKYLINWKDWRDSHPIFNAPCYIDAYLIRNCPFDFIQKELMLNYGHWSQERIKNFYEDVKNWKSDDCPYWAKLEDFVILEDGTMTIKGLEESDYSKIKKGELYNSPKIEYVAGKHFRCIQHPIKFYNRPFACKDWFIDVVPPKGNMWYHKNTNSWDFSEEFVTGDRISITYCKTIKALKRLIIKWKLPIGTKVYATGRYVEDNYKFIIKK